MKKKIKIVLTLTVTCLWGTIGYRFIKNYFFVPETGNNYSYNYHGKPHLVTKRDTFMLKSLKYDPFLNTAPPKSKKTSLPKAPRKEKCFKS